MSWNYRVYRTTEAMPDDTTAECYQFIECHYDEMMRPQGYCRADLSSYEGKEGLRWTLDRMSEALAKPVLNAEDFRKEKE